MIDHGMLTMSLYTCPDYAAIESQQDARRYSDMLDADERRSRAEFDMAADFLRACGKADANAVVHQVITEDELLAADRARNTNKAERATQANADRALDLQIKFQNLPGAWV